MMSILEWVVLALAILMLLAYAGLAALSTELLIRLVINDHNLIRVWKRRKPILVLTSAGLVALYVTVSLLDPLTLH